MANDSTIEVKIQATDSGLKAGMESAAQTIQQSSNQIQKRFSELGDATKAGMSKMQESVKNAHESISSSFSSLSGHFGKVNVLLAGLAAILAGGAVFKAGVNASKEFTGEANLMARALGISATEASTLNVALNSVGGSSEMMTGSAQALSRQLRTNEDGLKAMGLRTREANGEYRNMQDLMLDSIKVLNGYKEGTDRTLAAQTLFGRGAGDLATLLKVNDAVMEKARQTQEKFGLTVGVENVEAAKKYKESMKNVDFAMQGLKKAIGDALMPVLTELGAWFSAVGPAAITIIKGAIGGVISLFHGFALVIKSLWEIVKASFSNMTDIVSGFGKVLWAVIKGDFAGAAEAAKQSAMAIKKDWTGAFENIGEKARETGDKIYNLFARPTEIARKKIDSGKSYVAPGETGPEKEKKAESRVPLWDAMLKEMQMKAQEVAQKEGQFYEMSKAEEQKYWREKLTITTTGSKENLAVRSKIADLEKGMMHARFEAEISRLKKEEEAAGHNYAVKLAAAQKELALVAQMKGSESKEYGDAAAHISQLERERLEQGRKIAEQRAALGRDIMLAEIAVEENNMNLRRDLGLANQAEILAAEMDFEARRNEIRRFALTEARDTIDYNRDPVEYEKRSNAIEELEISHQAKLGEIQRKSQFAQAQPFLQLAQSLQQSLEQAFSGLLARTMTFSQAFKSIFASMTSSIIGELAKIAAQKTASIIIDKILAAKQILTNAAVSGSAAYAATAAIPIVGPSLAPAAAAAAYGGTASFVSSLAVAERGYDIPAGLNPITQLHQKEMVLPAEQANIIRDLAGSGGMGGNIIIETTGGDFIHKDDLARLLAKMKRNFQFL